MTIDRRSFYKSPYRPIAIVLFVALLFVLAENTLIPVYLVRIPRMTTDFSPAYLDRKLRALAAEPPQIVFLGDSAMWGFSLPPEQTAISVLAARGCRCVNLAFKAGSPANYYALARLFELYRVRPSLVIVEINQRALNPEDQSYKSLHPAIAALAAPLLTPADRETLGQPAAALNVRERFEDAFSRTWAVYAMRADLRALINGDVDALPKKKATADQFLGTYDLSPLGGNNIGVMYLEKTIDLLQRQHIRTVAFMTPTNHALLHEYIDDPAYTANGDYLVRLLRKRGVRTIDLDRAFPTVDFIDNAHLTEQGQVRLADVLSRQISALPSP